MESLTIQTKLGKSILLPGEKLAAVTKYLPDTKIAIITDKNIYKLYHTKFPSNAIVITIGTGEESKTLQTLEFIFGQLIAHDFDRSCFLLGIGGGIVCDITGFAASIYLRGVRFGFVSTTLLAQVDASIGGKNGVNFHGYKNMLGVFNQPEFVILDFEMLSTLPDEEYIAGYAEIIKHALIRNASLFQYLEKHVTDALNRNIDVIHRGVYESLIIKSDVVQQDEKEETGLRRILNFGHTVGHAIEKITGIIHGQAVSIGMVAAAKLSVQKGLLNQDDAIRIENLLKQFTLPVTTQVDPKKIADAIRKDKKREKDYINFILLKSIGSTQTVSINIKEMEEIIHDLR